MRFLVTMILVLVPAMALAGTGPDLTTCQSCTNVEDVLYPTPEGALVAGSTAGLENGEYAYAFSACAGETYFFTFCSNGGTADYDTCLDLWDDAGGVCGGSYYLCNDDTCGLLSQLTWVAPADGEYVLRVAGFSSSTGNYTLFYSGASCGPTATEPVTWSAVKTLYK